MSAQYSISVKDFSVNAGSTSEDGAFLEIEMSYPAEDKIRMAQFNITLPEGITFDEFAFELDKEYFPEYKEGRNMIQPFSVGYNTDTDGSTIVTVTTSKDYYFGKNEGVALKAYILTDANLADGTYTIKVDRGEFYSPSTGTHKGITSESIVTVGDVTAVPYYLVGNMTEWVPNADYQLTKNDAAETEEYMITLNLAADAQFKIAKSDDGVTIADDAWYPGGMKNAYGENGELAEAGNYTVYFRPKGDGGSDWFWSVIYVVTNSTVGIHSINADGTNGDIYNTAGQRVSRTSKGLYIQNGKKVVKK
jgi:hypothetical protein